MRKIFALIVTLALVLSLFSGCIGTTVVIGECDHEKETQQPTAPVLREGAVKTGLAVLCNVADSASATPEADGKAAYDITLAAVTVDDEGVIRSCIIDGISAGVGFNAAGEITTDTAAAVLSKNELGEAYGMVAYGGAIAEWNQQVAALADFAVGKTAAELRSGAIDESGKAPDGSDLASSATIYLGTCVSAIEKAVANAQHLGAQVGDELALGSLNSLKNSAASAADAPGNAQLDADIVAMTRKDGVITSCYIDALQAKIAFDASGILVTDLSIPVQSKNELGEAYGMVAWGGAMAEWNQQAAAFAQYVTGKTAAEVAGIAVSDTTKPEDGSDLASSVTIAIGGFQALIAKVMQE